LIRPRILEQVAEIDYEAINQMAYFDININDYKQQRVWAYVIPHITQHVLFGLFWARSQQVTIQYFNQGDFFHIGASDIFVKLKKKPDWKVDEFIKLVFIVAIRKILRKSRKAKKKIEIFSVILKDIEKAFKKLNQKKQPMDPKTKLPQYYYDKFDIKIFNLEIVKQKGLPLYRPGVNHAIKLKENELGKKKNVP
jgi:hypothetical protein